MTTKKSLPLVLTIFAIYSVTFGQTKKEKVITYKDKIKSILCDSTYQQITLSNKIYGSVSGYFKRDTIFLITELYNQPFGYKEQFFLLQNNNLTFVNTKETTIKWLYPDAIYADAVERITFDGSYEISGDMIVRKQKQGKPNQTDNALSDTGDLILYQNESAKYFLFYTKKYRGILLKRRNGS